VNVPTAEVDTVSEAVLFALTFIFASVPPFMSYVTVIGRFCGLVNTILGEGALWQTDVVPATEAVGVGLTVTVVDAMADGPLHPLA
jgi:hypothetical protein